jgi:ribonuclease T2
VPRVALKVLLLNNFRLSFLLALFCLAGCNDNANQTSVPTPIGDVASMGSKSNIPLGNGFDFYVLSLSWSPHYCASKGGKGDAQQCGAAKPFGFIVHGLWPQNERGYPEYCATSKEPTRDEIRSVLDLTPSYGLVRHEWEKHGTCSGLLPAQYFIAMRAARQAVTIPPQFANIKRAISLSANQIENSFTQSNSGLNSQSIAVDCDRQKLAEVRICFTKTMQFRACPEVDRAGCRSQSLTIEPIK